MTKYPFLLSVSFLLLCTACKEKQVVEEVIIEKEIDADALPALMHTVYVWLKPDLSEADEEEFLNSLRSLETIKTVKNFYIGPPAATESREVVDNSFSYALILWFDSLEDHLAYQVDPIHLKFVAENKDKWDRVRVRDNEVMK